MVAFEGQSNMSDVREVLELERKRQEPQNEEGLFWTWIAPSQHYEFLPPPAQRLLLYHFDQFGQRLGFLIFREVPVNPKYLKRSNSVSKNRVWEGPRGRPNGSKQQYYKRLKPCSYFHGSQWHSKIEFRGRVIWGTCLISISMQTTIYITKTRQARNGLSWQRHLGNIDKISVDIYHLPAVIFIFQSYARHNPRRWLGDLIPAFYSHDKLRMLWAPGSPASPFSPQCSMLEHRMRACAMRSRRFAFVLLTILQHYPRHQSRRDIEEKFHSTIGRFDFDWPDFVDRARQDYILLSLGSLGTFAAFKNMVYSSGCRWQSVYSRWALFQKDVIATMLALIRVQQIMW